MSRPIPSLSQGEVVYPPNIYQHVCPPGSHAVAAAVSEFSVLVWYYFNPDSGTWSKKPHFFGAKDKARAAHRTIRPSLWRRLLRR